MCGLYGLFGAKGRHEMRLEIKSYGTADVNFWPDVADGKRVHAVVARSTFAKVKMYKTRKVLDHFWKLRCGKSARRCGEKHILKSKVAKHVSLRTTFGSGGVEKVHAVVARSTFGSQNVQNTPFRTNFGSWDVEKVHAVVARSTFWSQNVAKHLRLRTYFWESFWCSKKCTPLWREAHFEVKSVKTPGVRTTFWRFDGKSMSKKCTPLWREAHFSKSKVSKTEGFEPLLLCQMSFCWQMDGYGKS